MVIPVRGFIWPLFAIHNLLWTGIDQERARLPCIPSVGCFNSFLISGIDSECSVYVGNGKEEIGIFKQTKQKLTAIFSSLYDALIG